MTTEKLKRGINRAVEAEEASLKQWLSGGNSVEKRLAMLDAVFANYIEMFGEADALEILTMYFHGYVSKKRGPVQ